MMMKLIMGPANIERILLTFQIPYTTASQFIKVKEKCKVSLRTLPLTIHATFY
jgi:hypothetical protein